MSVFVVALVVGVVAAVLHARKGRRKAAVGGVAVNEWEGLPSRLRDPETGLIL